MFGFKAPERSFGSRQGLEIRHFTRLAPNTKTALTTANPTPQASKVSCRSRNDYQFNFSGFLVILE